MTDTITPPLDELLANLDPPRQTDAELLEDLEATVTDAAPTKITCGQVIDAIVKQTGCTPKHASDFVDYLEIAVKRLRSGDEVVHVQQVEIDRFHRTMKLVMPGKQTKAPKGSTHALVNQLLLDAGKGETCLVHTRTRRRNLTFCALALELAKA